MAALQGTTGALTYGIAIALVRNIFCGQPEHAGAAAGDLRRNGDRRTDAQRPTLMIIQFEARLPSDAERYQIGVDV
ncbi:MAG: hypothetical protein EOO81_07290 [Oxalobacteraceae bacterium]|nr:MAG: hypothetical protein EOO81_07290 [Oxalobacteraceae bacterium]